MRTLFVVVSFVLVGSLQLVSSGNPPNPIPVPTGGSAPPLRVDPVKRAAKSALKEGAPDDGRRELHPAPAEDPAPRAAVIHVPITPIKNAPAPKQVLIHDSEEKANSSTAHDQSLSSSSAEDSATQIALDGKHGPGNALDETEIGVNNTLDAEMAEGLKLLFEQAMRQAQVNHENGLRRAHSEDARSNHGPLDGVKLGDYVVRDEVLDPRLGLRRYVFQKNAPAVSPPEGEPEMVLPVLDREKRHAESKVEPVEATIKNETETHGWKSWILQFGKDPNKPKPNISSPDNSPAGESHHHHHQRREALGEGSALLEPSAPSTEGAAEPTAESSSASTPESLPSSPVMAAQGNNSGGDGAVEVGLKHFVILDPPRQSANKKNSSSSSSASSESNRRSSQHTNKHFGGKWSDGDSSSDSRESHEKPGLKDFLLRPKPGPKPKPHPHPRPPHHRGGPVNFIREINVRVVKTGPIVIKNSTIQIGGGPKPHFPAMGFPPSPLFGLPPPPAAFQHFSPQFPPPSSMHHVRELLGRPGDADGRPSPPRTSSAWDNGKFAPPMLTMTLQVRPCLLLVVMVVAAILLGCKLIKKCRASSKIACPQSFCPKHDGGEKSYCSSCVDNEAKKTHMKA